MAAQDTQVIDLFADDTADPGASGADVADPGNGTAEKPKAKPKGKGKGAAAPSAPASTVNAIPPADTGTPEGEITPEASSELAKLAAKNGTDEVAAGGKGTKAKGKGVGAAPTATSEAASAESSADTADADDEKPVQREGESLYDFRQRQMAYAKTHGKNQSRSKLSAKERARREKEKAKEKADKLKAREKEKTQKQKDREKEKLEAKKKAQDERKKAEAERKALIAKTKAENAAKRALALVPGVLSKENAEVKAAFAEDFKQAAFIDPNGKPLKMTAGKTGKQIVAPGQPAMRRQKCDRGDFAAGYMMALRRLRAAAKA